MKEYRITKYNPASRNSEGHYLDQNEWTCFSEAGDKLTLKEYEFIEEKYIQAAVDFIGNDIENIIACDIENHDNENITEISEPMTVSSFQNILRGILRNKYWCRLKSNNSFVHIGWDYYMYVGCNKEVVSIINKTEKNGLYVEEMESPHK
jgi:hypothetical protein